MAKRGLYDEGQWKQIMLVVGGLSPEAEDRLAYALDTVMERYLDRAIEKEDLGSGTRQRDAFAQVERCARDLIEALRATNNCWPSEENVKGYKDKFVRLADDAENVCGIAGWYQADFANRARSFSGRQNPDRKELVLGILNIWADVLKRDLSYGRSKTRTITGPLFRFYNAALGHWQKHGLPKAEGFRAIVDDEKQRRSQILKQASGTLKSKTKSNSQLPIAN